MGPMLSMPPTAEPTARKTSNAVPRNSAASERARVGDIGTSGGPGQLPLHRRHHGAATPGTFGSRMLSAGGRLAVEDVLDDRAGMPGGPLVVVEELAGVHVGAVAAGAGDTRQLQPRPRQLVARPAAHQEDRVTGAGGQLPGRRERLELIGVQ